MDTKIKAQIDKITNLDAIWSQLNQFGVQLGLPVGVPGRPLEERDKSGNLQRSKLNLKVEKLKKYTLKEKLKS